MNRWWTLSEKSNGRKPYKNHIYTRAGGIILLILAGLASLHLLNVFTLPWLDYFLMAAAALTVVLMLRQEMVNRREKEIAVAIIQDLYDHAPCGYHSLNAEGVIIEINQTELNWLGYTREEVVGKISMTDLFDAEGVALFRSNFPTFLKTGSVNELPFELIAKNGERRSVLITSNAIYDQAGNFTSTRTTVFDIERRKNLETELRAAQEATERAAAQIRDLYDLAPCGYHSTDALGFFTEMNQTELDWIGYTREEVIGKMRLNNIVDEESAARLLEKFAGFLKTGSTHEIYINLIGKDGSSHPMLLSADAQFDKSGRYLGSRSTVFDIRERKKLETDLHEALQLADQARISQEQFLANMSHEIRTPMNAVIGFTGILQKTELTGQQEMYVESIRQAGENLLVIINDILDFSKLEAGMLRFEATPFSLHGLLHSLNTMLQTRAKEKKLHLQIHQAADLPDIIVGDPTRLTQILINTVGNALKFTESGTVNVFVEGVQHQENDLLVRFSVADTGIGIHASKLESIFERFVQGESNTSRLFGGTGLGLSITKKLIDLQGGSIYVESEPGIGSRFVFTLPYKLPEQGVENNQRSGEERPAVVPRRHEKERILVVEDNMVNRKLAGILLEEWGFAHDFAENGEIALEKLQNQTYNLILMDIQMPKVNGYEVTQALRKAHNPVPIIAMTAHVLPGEREKCLALGMNDYIPKPLREAVLRDLILKHIAS